MGRRILTLENGKKALTLNSLTKRRISAVEGDKYLGDENLLELLAFEAYAQNFQTLKEKDIVIAKPNYDEINEQRFESSMKNPEKCT